MNEDEKRMFDKAQKGEIAWWIQHHKNDLHIKNRDWYLGYRHHNWREVMHRFGMIKGHALNLKHLHQPILDLGSGMVSMLEGSGLVVHALEPTLDLLKQHFPSIVRIGTIGSTTYISGQIYSLDSLYGTVWCNNVLDHTPDWHKVLTEEIPRVTRSGGTLMLAVDVRKSKTTTNSMHMGQFTAEDLLNLLEVKMNYKTLQTAPLENKDIYRWYYIGKKP